MERISLPAPLIRKKPTLHSAAHLLADDLSKEMLEPERFGAYLGIARRYHESDLRALARRVREKENLPADARGKYFFAALRGLAPTPTARKKKKRSIKIKVKRIRKRLKRNMQKEKAAEPHAIVKEPHKVLRKKAAELLIHDITAPRVQRLIAGMQTTLAATPDGVGLAAPQIGESLRLFIVSEEAEEIDRAEKSGWERRQKHDRGAVAEKPYEKRPWRYYIFINPVLKNHSRRVIPGPEGCLSVPCTFGEVSRYEKLTIEAHNEHGKKFTRNCSRFFARVIQHELDHLEGTLFIDKAEDLIQIPEKAVAKNEK